MSKLSDAEMQAFVQRMRERDLSAEQATAGWASINADVRARFPTTIGSGQGAGGLVVQLRERDEATERLIRERYGEATEFRYGNIFAT